MQGNHKVLIGVAPSSGLEFQKLQVFKQWGTRGAPQVWNDAQKILLTVARLTVTIDVAVRDRRAEMATAEVDINWVDLDIVLQFA